jgi:chromosome segregation ATPase
VAQVRDLTTAMQRLEGNIGGFASAESSVSALQNDVRELKEVARRMQDRQTELANRTEESLRRRESEAHVGNNQHNAVSKQLEALDKITTGYESRLHGLDMAMRQIEDETASLRQLQQNVARQTDEVGLKYGRQQDTLGRLSATSERIVADMEALQKQDDGLAERLRVQNELLRRSEERIEQVARSTEVIQALTEEQERLRTEIQRQGDRLGVVERTLEEQTQHVTNVLSGITLLDQRLQTQAGRLLTVSQDMETFRDQVKEQLTRMIRTLERQRRRQIEAMTQEIKEIRQSDLNYSREQQ